MVAEWDGGRECGGGYVVSQQLRIPGAKAPFRGERGRRVKPGSSTEVKIEKQVLPFGLAQGRLWAGKSALLKDGKLF